jgi:beta-glucosidase-like glycosyl hydrolase
MWVRAAQGEGVLACAKHYPGHGRTFQDSHDVIPTVESGLEELAGSDLRPFESAVRANVASIMTAHVRLPSWDASGEPATRSSVMIGYLRAALGFDGLVVTDALVMEGGGQSAEEEVVRPIRGRVAAVSPHPAAVTHAGSVIPIPMSQVSRKVRGRHSG